MSRQPLTAVQRWIVTAWDSNGGAYRFVADSSEGAERQRVIFNEIGLERVSVRRVLMDKRGNIV